MYPGVEVTCLSMFPLMLLIKPAQGLTLNNDERGAFRRFSGWVFGGGVPALLSGALLPADGGGGAERPVCGGLLLSRGADL